MLLEEIKMLLDYSSSNKFNNAYDHVEGEIIKAYKINDKTSIYINDGDATIAPIKYFKELDLYYEAGGFIRLGKVSSADNNKKTIINLYQKLESTSLLDYMLSPEFNMLFDIDFNVTKLIKEANNK